MLAGTGRQVKIFGGAGNHEYVPWKKTHVNTAKHLLPISSPDFDYYNQGELEIDAAILRTCRQVHDEAEPTLYRLHDFGFGTNTPSVMSFLQTISDRARQNIRCIGMAFVAWSNVGGSLGRLMTQDYQNWSLACSCIAENLQLHELVLDLDIPAKVSGFEQWECIQDLLKIKNLKRLTQQPLYEERSFQWYRAVIDGAVVTIRKRDWLRSMDSLLLFLVERMVRKECTPQEKPRWRWDGYVQIVALIEGLLWLSGVLWWFLDACLLGGKEFNTSTNRVFIHILVLKAWYAQTISRMHSSSSI